MAQTIVQFDTPIVHTDGARYVAKACGREREDGLWEGWIEFEDAASGKVLRTVRETTQPNLADLKYWATGLSAVYLQGALDRILRAPAPRHYPAVEPPRFEEPAEPRVPAGSPKGSILDPFSVYDKSPTVLAQELTALRGWHLRQIIRDYHLVDEADLPLEAMSEPELGTLILQRVRALHG
jgi:hypothetical protein